MYVRVSLLAGLMTCRVTVVTRINLISIRYRVYSNITIDATQIETSRRFLLYTAKYWSYLLAT